MVTDKVVPAGAKVKGVLVAGDALDLHHVDQFTFGRVQLPFAEEGVVRRR
jgi:hypothetical protein